MKNYRLSTRTLAAAVGLLSISGAMAQQQINVVVNGKLVAFDNVGPREVRGRVLVPLRGVLEELGAYVGWDQTTRTVSATKGNLDMKLMIGSRTASVNGSNVPLDVPAEVYDGSTMVPLRFVSETLGANVQWLQASNTVQIDAPMTESYRSTAPPTTTAVNAAPVKISTFSADHTGFFPSASNITFTMIGTPGGKATFQIPGVTGEIPMQETQPGTYVGQWMPPAASDQGFEMSSTTAIGHLIVGSSDQATVTNATFSIDTRPPPHRKHEAEPGWPGRTKAENRRPL